MAYKAQCWSEKTGMERQVKLCSHLLSCAVQCWAARAAHEIKQTGMVWQVILRCHEGNRLEWNGIYMYIFELGFFTKAKADCIYF